MFGGDFERFASVFIWKKKTILWFFSDRLFMMFCDVQIPIYIYFISTFWAFPGFSLQLQQRQETEWERERERERERLSGASHYLAIVSIF